MAISLNPSEEAVLLQANRAAVVDALAGINLTGNNQWLPPGHPAASGIDNTHKPSGSNPISGPDLAVYFAAAAPTHCADGWSYLSRALNAYLLGDAHSSWHFAYYAELRAAQSILSASGCGAFDKWNCVIDAGGVVHLAVKQPTHVMVWLALALFAKSSESISAKIASATSVFGVPIQEIVNLGFPGSGFSAGSATWIKEWIYDLETSSADKSFRNRCSYNPHLVTPHYSFMNESTAWVSALWDALRPTPGADFMEIDKYIIRVALRKIAKMQLEASLGLGNFTDLNVENELSLAYDRIISAEPTIGNISRDFIVDAVAPDHPLLTYASDPNPAPSTPRPALARATLLLRIATGMTKNLLHDAGKDTELEFWLNDLANKQGLVSGADGVPNPRSDYYEDCAIAVQDMNNVIERGNAGLADLINNVRIKPHLLAQAERVVQWSFVS
ncbi:hypothetical protein PSQ40_07430 [Curvibacter sp. HBC61]|uniref:Uncharacterized protein n=1 Tax=Curvibacter cyanobacteriorum TaxID=3026422 RepID=A0ABT5MWH4_9BURK|nr:hypothetical protein [Curvibacter sp. HBC61]MDD0838399.1 hypothetical protein [Curvibacter sp. HBC61]